MKIFRINCFSCSAFSLSILQIYTDNIDYHFTILWEIVSIAERIINHKAISGEDTSVCETSSFVQPIAPSVSVFYSSVTRQVAFRYSKDLFRDTIYLFRVINPPIPCHQPTYSVTYGRIEWANGKEETGMRRGKT